MLTTVATFREAVEAHMLRGRLDAEGFFAIVVHEFHVGNNWMYSTALGGAKVQVLDVDARDARDVERRCQAGEFKSDLEAQFGDLDDPRCPVCGANDYWKRRPIIPAMFAALWLIPGGVIVPPLRWICVCNKCGTKFKLGYGLIGKTKSGWQFAMTFAEATIADIPQMQDIRMAVRENVLSDPSRIQPADIVKMIEEDGKGWVCKIDDVVRGFSFANLRTRNIWALFVDPNFERCGIGRQLHNYAVGWLFNQGIALINARTNPNRKAEKFLNALGWRLADLEPDGSYRYELDWKHWQAKVNRPRSLMGLLRAWRNRET